MRAAVPARAAAGSAAAKATPGGPHRGGACAPALPRAAAMIRRLFALLALAFAVAAPAGAAGQGPYQPGAQPLAPALGLALPAGDTRYSNESLADLFVTLTHELEWGARRRHLIRYEGPISVGITGPGAERYLGFLDRYLAELRIRAGVPIARGTAPPNLLISFVSGEEFRARVPRHYCVVAPGSPNWDRFSRSPRRYGTRPFESMETVGSMTVFIPDSAEPYLVRACMIEEIAQALGPANDLYALGPSIFNDDAAHVWPTRLDYLMLSVLYSPELRTGLNRRETRARALAVLDRLNPKGRGAPPLPPLRTREMADWAETMRDAFDRSRPVRKRIASAVEALDTAQRRAPGTAYHCRSLQALARAYGDDPTNALRVLDDAALVCAAAHGGEDIRLAQIRLDKARMLYRTGRAASAWNAAQGLGEIFAGYGQEERVTAFFDLEAAVMQATKQTLHSSDAIRQAGAWGAFALGRDNAMLRRWTTE